MAEAFNLPTKEQFDLMNSYLANISIPKAAKVTIADAGSYYTSENVEGALQEAGEQINSLNVQVSDVEIQITPVTFLCTPSTGITIPTNMCKIIGKMAYISLQISKTDGTDFEIGWHDIGTVPNTPESPQLGLSCTGMSSVGMATRVVSAALAKWNKMINVNCMEQTKYIYINGFYEIV